MVTEALILEVKDNIVKKCKRLRRLTEKVIDLRDDVVIQKAEIKTLKTRRREDTTAIGITAGLSTMMIKKKKSLNHLKRLNDGKVPSYEFW